MGTKGEVKTFDDDSYVWDKPFSITNPSTEQAKQWSGWGTALKPAHEPIVLARKPLSEKTVAENVLKWGVGGLNIDGCRVGSDVMINPPGFNNWNNYRHGINKYHVKEEQSTIAQGRWPANLIHDGSEEVESLFPYSKGGGKRNSSNNKKSPDNMLLYTPKEAIYDNNTYGDVGSASRFFYCAKASKKDRNDGLDDFEVKNKVFNGQNTQATIDGYKEGSVEDKFTTQPSPNNHPTVKPTDLMAYLVRLVTPPNGTVLDPFNGSGSTGKACMREGFKYIGIDLSKEYLDISKARIEHELSKKIV